MTNPCITWQPPSALGFFGQDEELGDAGAIIQHKTPFAGFAVVRRQEHTLPAAASLQGSGQGNEGKERGGGRGGLIWGPASRRAGSGCRIASARGRRPPTTAPRWRRRAGSRRSSAPRACSPWRPEQAAPPLAERLGRLASSFELAGRWYYQVRKWAGPHSLQKLAIFSTGPG